MRRAVLKSFLMRNVIPSSPLLFPVSSYLSPHTCCGSRNNSNAAAKALGGWYGRPRCSPVGVTVPYVIIGPRRSRCCAWWYYSRAPAEHVQVQTGQIGLMASSDAALHQHVCVGITSSGAQHSLLLDQVKGRTNIPKPSIFLPLLTFSGLSDLLTNQIQKKTSAVHISASGCLTEMLFFVFIPLKTPQTHHCLSRWLKELMKTGPQSQKWSALEIFLLMYRRASEWGLRTFQNHIWVIIWSPFDQSSRFFTCQTNQCTFEMVRYCCSGPSYALVNVSLGALSGFALAKDSVHQTLFL